MGLLDEASTFAAARRPGPKCSVCKFLATQTPFEQAEWQAVLDSELTSATISAFMHERDIEIHAQAVSRHRRGHR